MTSEIDKLNAELETRKHIHQVRKLLQEMVVMLLKRGENHDATKLEAPEAEGFAEYTPKLATSTYGSDEYNQFLKDMQPFLKFHYMKNSHHPEFYENGVDDMNLIDLIEMLCDWKAATLRHNDGDIHKSIEHNADRFGLSPQIVHIFRNTAKSLGW